MDNFEEWAREKFSILGVDPPENEKHWIPLLEDLLDTDIGCLYEMEGRCKKGITIVKKL